MRFRIRIHGVVLSKRVEEAEDRKADDSDGVVGGGR